MTSYRTRVVVRPLFKSSNSETEQIVFVALQRQSVELSWNSPLELVVNCHTCREENVEYEVTKVGKIKISYILAGTKMPT